MAYADNTFADYIAGANASKIRVHAGTYTLDAGQRTLLGDLAEGCAAAGVDPFGLLLAGAKNGKNVGNHAASAYVGDAVTLGG